MALFGGSKASTIAAAAPIDPKWVRAPNGSFHQLLEVDPDALGIRGVGGVFVVWHGGIRPQWVYAGESPNIARALEALVDDPEVTQYKTNGGLFVTWSLVKEEFRRGVLLHLTRALKPLVLNPRAPTEETEHTKPIAVLVPGGKPAAR
jgi:hypothetical protein